MSGAETNVYGMELYIFKFLVQVMSALYISNIYMKLELGLTPCNPSPFNYLRSLFHLMPI